MPLSAKHDSLVVCTSSEATRRVGEAILADGGSATDAALAIAIVQPALCAGCWDSYAGILGFLHFESESGTVSSLNAGFNTLRGAVGQVLVPGFFAGVDEAHRRFGRLPLARLIAPAIAVAEEGFPVEADFAAVLRGRRRVLLRRPEGRAVFQQPSGGVHEAGQTLRQPALAHTLSNVAAHGSDYFYRGAWARRFVEIARREGESLNLDDLDSYRATWTSPLKTTIAGLDVHGPGLPGVGGLYLIEALNLCRAAHLDRAEISEVEFLFWLIQISRARYFGPGVPQETRAHAESAERLWEQMRRRGGWNVTDAIRTVWPTAHSDAVVVGDARGNVAALCHSIATVQWGSSGLFVDGVSIPDAAAHQRRAITSLGRGRRVPDAMNPTIALRDGHLRLACAAIGASVHELTLHTIMRMVRAPHVLSDDPDAPEFLCPQWEGLYRLAAFRGRIAELLTDVLFSLTAALLQPSSRLSRRVLDVAAPILEGVGADRLSDELERRGQPIVRSLRDPMPSTLAAIEVGGDGPVAVLRTTAPSRCRTRET